MNAGNLIQVQPDSSIGVCKNDDGKYGLVIAGNADPCFCEDNGDCTKGIKSAIAVVSGNATCGSCVGSYQPVSGDGTYAFSTVSGGVLTGRTINVWSNLHPNCSGPADFTTAIGANLSFHAGGSGWVFDFSVSGSASGSSLFSGSITVPVCTRVFTIANTQNCAPFNLIAAGGSATIALKFK